MIVIKMELWPGGDEGRKRMLAVIVVANDGTGNKDVGNYHYALSHAGTFFGKKGDYKRGRITGFVRRLSPYRLLCRILRDAKET